MNNLIKKYWFLIGLVLVFAVTVLDFTDHISDAGKFMKSCNGPNFVIFIIFLFSGFGIDTSQIKAGLKDLTGLITALVLIFIIAPCFGFLFGMLPFYHEIILGIFLVSVLPTTLSSGVVMTGASGGNMVHALLITIISNFIAIFTIPVTLSLLLSTAAGGGVIEIDKIAIVLKLGALVLTPLFMGIVTKNLIMPVIQKTRLNISIVNQLLILVMIWMALSQSKQVVVNNSEMIISIFFAVFLFHGTLVGSAFAATSILKIGKTRRESIIFMGGQKTLPLSVILQVTLFPEAGIVLAVCVIHHIVHLLMDSFLVGKLGQSK